MPTELGKIVQDLGMKSTHTYPENRLGPSTYDKSSCRNKGQHFANERDGKFTDFQAPFVLEWSRLPPDQQRPECTACLRGQTSQAGSNPGP